MIAHFDTCSILSDEYVHKFNSILPNDIIINSIEKVSKNTHARFDAITRSYEYRILMQKNAFLE